VKDDRDKLTGYLSLLALVVILVLLAYVIVDAWFS
jgi:hypothetical protein